MHLWVSFLHPATSPPCGLREGGPVRERHRGPPELPPRQIQDLPGTQGVFTQSSPCRVLPAPSPQPGQPAEIPSSGDDSSDKKLFVCQAVIGVLWGEALWFSWSVGCDFLCCAFALQTSECSRPEKNIPVWGRWGGGWRADGKAGCSRFGVLEMQAAAGPRRADWLLGVAGKVTDSHHKSSPQAPGHVAGDPTLTLMPLGCRWGRQDRPRRSPNTVHT